MPLVRIPTILRKHTDGEAKVEADGKTVREVFDQLVADHPGLGDDLLADGEVRRFINVYVDDEDIRYVSGLDTEVDDDTEIAIMPAVAGGAEAAQPPSTHGADRIAGGAVATAGGGQAAAAHAGR